MTSAPQAVSDDASMNQLVLTLHTTLAESQKENSLLRQKIDSLLRRLFGASSEKVDPSQLQLLMQLAGTDQPERAKEQAPAVKLEKVSDTSRPRKLKVQRIPDNLPVVEQVIEPAEVLAAPDQWRFLANEVSEQLDFTPGQFLRRRLIRRKYVHISNPDCPPVIAPLPEKLQERGVAGPGLLAHVVVSKFNDHLPLYRLEQIFGQRYQINIPRQTLARWMELAADWLQSIYHKIHAAVFSSSSVQVDETPIEYLAPGNGSTKQGYLWTASKPGSDAVFQWETSRSAAVLEKFVPSNFKGVIQCDGFSAYPAFASRREGIKLAGCWAHARRRFVEPAEKGCRRSAWVLRQMQHLYKIEDDLRRNKAGPKLRAAVRQCQSKPIVERIKKGLLLFQANRRCLPQHYLGEAIGYAMSQWTSLLVYLDEGGVEIDNNTMENAIRPTAIGKNYAQLSVMRRCRPLLTDFRWFIDLILENDVNGMMAKPCTSLCYGGSHDQIIFLKFFSFVARLSSHLRIILQDFAVIFTTQGHALRASGPRQS